MIFITKTLYLKNTIFPKHEKNKKMQKNTIFPHKREKKGKTRKSRFSRNRVFVMALGITYGSCTIIVASPNWQLYSKLSISNG